MLDKAMPIYTVQSWTVEKKSTGWYVTRTCVGDDCRGPCCGGSILSSQSSQTMS